LIDDLGAKQALSMALAYISGNVHKIEHRSMITGQENVVTFIITTSDDIRNTSFVWGIFKKLFPEDI
jgi:hypothetical protein